MNVEFPDADRLQGATDHSVVDLPEFAVAPDSLVVSEPVASELRERDDVTVGPLTSLEFEARQLPADPY